ncbi:MAG: hypothetical protein RL528_1616 [Bacteroidota bacterium]|jgi:hypothetical protein
MKNIRVLYFILVASMLVLTACEPIIDEIGLTDTTNVEGVQLVAANSPAGGNKVKLSMVTPGITGYWDVGTGKVLSNEATLVLPYTGKHTLTYVGKLGVSFFTKTIDVTVDRLDTPLDPMYYKLAGSNPAAGKDWVLDNQGGVDKKWFFMSPANDISKALQVLVNYGAFAPPSDVDGKMNFNCAGGLNCNYYKSRTGNAVRGQFILDIARKRLTCFGGNPAGSILGGEKGSPDGIYNIISITDTELVLYDALNREDGAGFTFVYKAL